ncbi:hypothetical protein HPP92_007984 [Vanilla planifolia]|uniref:Uncharacterized protein n=1 Tax=Vanilla planifolia TaxID=51239 RepID=A0A835V988_VANPL|nr:hypothetical protein HPP92_007984 [Vanilla planifolia]
MKCIGIFAARKQFSFTEGYSRRKVVDLVSKVVVACKGGDRPFVHKVAWNLSYVSCGWRLLENLDLLERSKRVKD